MHSIKNTLNDTKFVSLFNNDYKTTYHIRNNICRYAYTCMYVHVCICYLLISYFSEFEKGGSAILVRQFIGAWSLVEIVGRGPCGEGLTSATRSRKKTNSWNYLYTAVFSLENDRIPRVIFIRPGWSTSRGFQMGNPDVRQRSRRTRMTSFRHRYTEYGKFPPHWIGRFIFPSDFTRQGWRINFLWIW